MKKDYEQDRPRRRLFDHNHEKRPLTVWVVPLLIILAVIFFLPKIVALLEN